MSSPRYLIARCTRFLGLNLANIPPSIPVTQPMMRNNTPSGRTASKEDVNRDGQMPEQAEKAP